MTSGTRTRLDVAFPSAGDGCRAWLFMPDAELPPLVILGHGLGATREMRPDACDSRPQGHSASSLSGRVIRRAS